MVGNFLSKGNAVVIGRDTNQASQMIKRAVTAGLMAAGVEVIDFGVAPIPAIHYGTGLYNATVVITVTTSHIHPDEISIKIFSSHKIPMAQERTEKVSWEDVGSLSYVYDYRAKYRDAVVENVDAELIRDQASKVVLDCANASAVPFTPEILSKVGCETLLFESHGIMEQPWGQRVMRFYDPDDYIIEVGEPLDAVVKRMAQQGLTEEEIAERSSIPLEFVQMMLK